MNCSGRVLAAAAVMAGLRICEEGRAGGRGAGSALTRSIGPVDHDRAGARDGSAVGTRGLALIAELAGAGPHDAAGAPHRAAIGPGHRAGPTADAGSAAAGSVDSVGAAPGINRCVA